MTSWKLGWSKGALWLVSCAVILTGCLNRPPSPRPSHLGEAPHHPETGICTAIRGNGNLIFAHFGAIARILEDVGEIRAMAGSSSGSISAFFYESMLLNPAMPPKSADDTDPGSEAPTGEHSEATAQKRRDTLALLVKSLLGFVLVVGDSPEGHALGTFVSIGQKVRDLGLLSLVRVNWLDAARKLHRILSDPEVRELINPAALDLLVIRDRTGMRNYRFRIEELVKAASVIGGFEPKDPSMFFREPILNFDGFANVLGRIANFYAGADPESNARLQDFVRTCLPLSHGRTWSQIAAQPVAQGTCGSLFARAVNTYRQRARNGSWTPPPNQDRRTHKLGQHLLVYVPVAILAGAPAVDTFNQSLASYRTEKKAALPVDFDDVRFGYFSPYPHGFDAIATMKTTFPDNAKIAKAVPLNTQSPVTWYEAIRYSTMEPGLSRIVPAGSERAYIGGWADLHPTQILRAAGCDRIIYINRIGAETMFIAKQHDYAHLTPGERHGVAEWLNMTAEQYWRLYDMRNPDNAYNQSVREADAVWCTDWDSAKPDEISYMFDHSYGAMPSSRGPHAGHIAGMAVRRIGDQPLFLRGDIPEIETPLWGCHAP